MKSPFPVLFIWLTFQLMQDVSASAFLLRKCLRSGQLTPVQRFLVPNREICRHNQDLNLEFCRFASTNQTSQEVIDGQRLVQTKLEISPESSFDPENQSLENPELVYLNVYNLFEVHPFIRMLKFLEPHFDLDSLYHSSISYRGK